MKENKKKILLILFSLILLIERINSQKIAIIGAGIGSGGSFFLLIYIFI